METTDRRLWGAITPGRVVSYLAYLALDLWVAIVCIVVGTVGVALSLGLAITVVGGVVALTTTLAGAQLIATFERARVSALLGEAIPAPAPSPRSLQATRLNVVSRLVHNASAWKALAYLFVQPIIGVLMFSVTICVWCLGPLLVSMPMSRNLFPNDSANLLVADVDSLKLAFVAAALGIGVIIAAPIVTIAAGSVDLWLVRTLLGSNKEAVLQAELVEVSARRSAAVEAADAERRRIERDLHDGAQQRLVALGMTLGLAREKLDDDPQAVKLLLDEAHLEAKAAMTELRSIARGIHPAILDDRGLDAALSAVAARCPIPVAVKVDLPERLGQTLESSAYYVVSEALTNVAKHADADHVSVTVFLGSSPGVATPRRVTKSLIVIISDDGQGGATFAVDGGLSGLQDRVRAVNGQLTLYSPVGGPTVLTAEIPT